MKLKRDGKITLLAFALIALVVTAVAAVPGIFSTVNATTGYLLNGSGGLLGQALCSDATYYDTPCNVYQTIAANGTTVTQRPTLNLISGTSASVACVDNSGANRTDCTVSGTTSAVDYYWTAAGCSTATGQPVHCTTTTTLPGNMPDASYQIFCQANVQTFSGSPPDLVCTLNSDYPLPTASGSTLTFDSVQVMQNGGGGGTSVMYFHAHHD